jgi:MYXO-CTERM domain-containing protein
MEDAMRKFGQMLVLAVWAGVLTPGDAEACGGCFAPPNAVQVVTDHRMVLSLSTTQTALWDQFQYSGRPEDFSWILPIRNGPDVRIELADNAFMTVLDNITVPALNAPRPPSRSCFDDADFAGARGSGAPTAAADAGAAPPPVQVLQESVVGPYQTVTLRGEDPMALRNWLRDNGYAVPRPIEPVIDHYVGLRMDFLALRLRPGEGINRMQPVRVMTPGYQPTLPLRMIAAGAADKVGLLLTVLAPSRIGAMNFPNGEVQDRDLIWNWAFPGNPQADLRTAFEGINRANRGRAWLTESAFQLNRFTLEGPIRSGALGRRGPVGPGVPPGGPGAGLDDVREAFRGLGDNAYVTRLRADLPTTALDQDLILSASDRGNRERFYTYGTVVGSPPPAPPCGGREEAIFVGGSGSSGGGVTTFQCSTRPGAPGSLAVLVGAALAALGLRRRRR